MLTKGRKIPCDGAHDDFGQTVFLADDDTYIILAEFAQKLHSNIHLVVIEDDSIDVGDRHDILPISAFDLEVVEIE